MKTLASFERPRTYAAATMPVDADEIPDAPSPITTAVTRGSVRSQAIASAAGVVARARAIAAAN